MKHWMAVILAVTCLAVQAQTPRPPGTGGPYNGGGIRGAEGITGDGALVTPEEAQRFQGEAGYNEPPPLRARALAPAIEILRPQPAADLKLTSPFAIAVQFRPQADSPIVPASFKVLYGALRLDITARITKFVTVTSEGFTFDQARIPPGRHKLVLQVQDEKQRVAERELRFEVE